MEIQNNKDDYERGNVIDMVEKWVSIISPVYNGEKYIANYLDSILKQTYPHIELIIIDDGSQDKTENIVFEFHKKFTNRGYKLIYKKQKENKGQAAAINVGLKLFSGEYMTWMDSDDIFYSDAIEKKVAFLEHHLEYDYALNEGEIVSENNLEKRKGVIRRIEPKEKDCLFEDLLKEENVVFAPGSIIVRTDSLKRALPDLSIFESREGQNWQLMLPLAYTCKYGYLKEVLFKYVVRNDSHSHMKRTFQKEMERRKNFYVLQKNTINKIVGMSETEKVYWTKYAEDRMLYSQYVMANRYHQYAVSKKLKDKLTKKDIKINFRDRAIVVDIIEGENALKGILKRILPFT